MRYRLGRNIPPITDFLPWDLEIAITFPVAKLLRLHINHKLKELQTKILTFSALSFCFLFSETFSRLLQLRP